MAESRIDQDWRHTSSILALLVNVNRDPKKDKAARPSDFHPMTAANSKPVKLPGSVAMLKTVFVDSQRKV